MRVLIAISLLVVAVLGCYCSRAAEDTNQLVWHSPDASVQKRAEAAARLVPKGTKLAEAERILGEPTRCERFHGPIIYPPNYAGPTNATYLDRWRDIYDFSGGDYVCLTFDIEASRSSWKDRPLLYISAGNTNADEGTKSSRNKK